MEIHGMIAASNQIAHQIVIEFVVLDFPIRPDQPEMRQTVFGLVNLNTMMGGQFLVFFRFNGVYLEPGKYTFQGTLTLMVVCPQFSVRKPRCFWSLDQQEFYLLELPRVSR